jgi:hypothetical protein
MVSGLTIVVVHFFLLATLSKPTPEKSSSGVVYSSGVDAWAQVINKFKNKQKHNKNLSI